MSQSTRRRDRLVVLFLLGFLAFNYPLLGLFATDGMLLGLPVLFLYLFGVWAVFIFLIWWLLSGHREGSGEQPGQQPTDRKR